MRGKSGTTWAAMMRPQEEKFMGGGTTILERGSESVELGDLNSVGCG